MKSFLSLDSGNNLDDGLIMAFITAARQYAESYTNRVFFNQTWQLTLANFPFWIPNTTVGSSKDFYNGQYWIKQSAIRFSKPSLVSVTSITYVNTIGTTITLDPSTYLVDPTQEPGIVAPVQSYCWPSSQIFMPGSVKATFVAGSYGDGVTVNTIPQTINVAIQLLVSTWYANREGTSGNQLSVIPFGVRVLLDTVKFHCFDFGSQG
jgi:uncharacterized phiE125 gp8 family phage protein